MDRNLRNYNLTSQPCFYLSNIKNAIYPEIQVSILSSAPTPTKHTWTT